MLLVRVTPAAVILTLSFGFTTAQSLPRGIRQYLDRNYARWELAPSRRDCNADVNRGFVTGDFDGDKIRDYAVKFTQRRRGFMLAFLRRGYGFRPFILHRFEDGDAKNSSIGVLRKGQVFENSARRVLLRRDAPYDYRCESDVGGLHYYQNGRFVGY
jgi:hypothetical protein